MFRDLGIIRNNLITFRNCNSARIFPLSKKNGFMFFQNILLSFTKEDSDLFNPLSSNPTKWSNTFKQFVGKLPTNCLIVFDHFVKMALKRLRTFSVLFYRVYCNDLIAVYMPLRLLHFFLTLYCLRV